MNCPHCNKEIPDKLLARHLASKGGRKPKNFSPAERKKRAERMVENQKKRWPKKRK